MIAAPTAPRKRGHRAVGSADERAPVRRGRRDRRTWLQSFAVSFAPLDVNGDQPRWIVHRPPVRSTAADTDIVRVVRPLAVDDVRRYELATAVLAVLVRLQPGHRSVQK